MNRSLSHPGGIIQYDVSQTSEKDSQPVVLTKTPKQDNNETTIVLAPNNQEKADGSQRMERVIIMMQMGINV